MLNKLLLLSSLVSSILLTTTAAQAAEDEATLIIRGEYLATVGDCASCHNNPDDRTFYSGGTAIPSPFGVVFSANITPSKVNGIGNYTLEDFSNAIRYGKSKKGHLFPTMPYTAFVGMTDEDTKALYTYFMKGVDPIDHEVPETNLGFPFVRPAMAGWNLLFLNKTEVAGSDAAEGSMARGKYLVRTLAHCSYCHTPRNAFSAENISAFLSGGKVGKWSAPNITQDWETGIGSWSEDNIYTYLKDGHLKNRIFAEGYMGAAVESSFSKLSDEDLHAITTYIKSVPNIKNPLSARKPKIKTADINLAEIEAGKPTKLDVDLDLSTSTGAQIYNGACASCHGAYGQGSRDQSKPGDTRSFPPLVGTTAVSTKDPSNLIMIISHGVSRKTGDGHVFMPAFKNQLSIDEIQKVTDYVSTTFGNPQNHVTSEQVSKTLSNAPQLGFILKNIKLLLFFGFGLLILVFLALFFYVFRIRKRGLV